MEDWVDNARMIVDSAAAVVPPDGSLSRVRAQRYHLPGLSADMMAQMGALGWLQLCVPEKVGGAGLGLRECVSLMIALGRGLVPEPVVSALLAQRVLAGHLPDAALSGEAITVAVLGDTLDCIEPPEAGDVLTGTRPAVAGAPGAAFFAVLAPGAAALVPVDAPGLTITPIARQDGGFDGTLTFDGTPAEWHPADTDRAIDEAILSQSAYLVGTAERGIEMTLDYLRIRKQFGRPIGSFQSLQHRATELKISLELCRAALFATAGRIDGGLAPLPRAAAVSRVKARAATLALHMAREAVQMHGAIGITDEADVGLVVRKAMTEANRFGSARLHRLRHFTASERSAA